MSKFAMEGYCDTIRFVNLLEKRNNHLHPIRRELQCFGVHVAIVEPGYFRTPITDPNHIPSTMERSFRQAPLHIREQYGEEFLQKCMQLAHDHLASAANSTHVEWVIDV